ncbi:MAG: MBL fold metallo-hydrolase [Ignavibacteria bacterium]|nr:MBL fold metallo-hydrolase [Ignavibacteria bacterium]
MLIRLWGVRGSVPTPPTTAQYRDKLRQVLKLSAGRSFESDSDADAFIESLDDSLKYLLGGNTTCIEVVANDTRLIFDMGSGIRELGNHLLKSADPLNEMHIFISHTHWDHIQGWPFFKPAYMPKYKMNFYSPHGNFEQRLTEQQEFKFFPVSLNFMASKKEYKEFPPETSLEINGIKIKNLELHHPGKSYGYRVEYQGKVFVFASDSEYNNFTTQKFQKFIDFFGKADIIVFDAQYSFDQEMQRVDWGHSSAFVGVDLAMQAEAKTLILFHHEPDNDDFEIYSLFSKSVQYKNDNYPGHDLEIFLAREGQVFEI